MKWRLSTPFLALVILGCNDSSSSNGAWYSGKEIVPLAVGNTWVYYHESFLENGMIDTGHYDEKPFPHLDTSKIISSSYREGEYYFRYYGLSDVDAPSYEYLSRDDGYWVYSYSMGSPPSFHHSVIFPPNSMPDTHIVASYYRRYIDSLHVDHYDTLVLRSICNSFMPVRAEAGTFSCYRYRYEAYYKSAGVLRDYWDSYYCPGVGLVKYEWYWPDKKGTFYLSERQSLVSYELR